jgi:hypothetical protein
MPKTGRKLPSGYAIELTPNRTRLILASFHAIRPSTIARYRTELPPDLRFAELDVNEPDRPSWLGPGTLLLVPQHLDRGRRGDANKASEFYVMRCGANSKSAVFGPFAIR